jgi:hypothetical protein
VKDEVSLRAQPSPAYSGPQWGARLLFRWRNQGAITNGCAAREGLDRYGDTEASGAHVRGCVALRLAVYCVRICNQLTNRTILANSNACSILIRGGSHEERMQRWSWNGKVPGVRRARATSVTPATVQSTCTLTIALPARIRAAVGLARAWGSSGDRKVRRSSFRAHIGLDRRNDTNGEFENP